MGMFYGHNKPIDIIYNYGLLYNRYAIITANFAPLNWAVPSVAQLNTLITTVGGTSYAGGSLKSRNPVDWRTDVVYYGLDYGFNAIGVGSRDSNGVYILNLLSTRFGAYAPYLTQPALSISVNSISVVAVSETSGVNTKYGVSVRLIYTGGGTPSSTLTDYDGNIYDVVQIGSQYWIKQNWKCTHLNDGTVIPEVTNDTTWAGLTTGALCAYNNDWNYV